MVNKEETFEEALRDLKCFLTQKRILSTISNRINVSLRTVNLAFDIKSEEELVGKKLLVIMEAKKMREEIETALNSSNKTTNEND